MCWELVKQVCGFSTHPQALQSNESIQPCEGATIALWLCLCKVLGSLIKEWHFRPGSNPHCLKMFKWVKKKLITAGI